MLKSRKIALASSAVAVSAVLGVSLPALADTAASTTVSAGSTGTSTPIQHLVVIFGENVSFDHYFGTYPNATNPAGEPTFTSASNTPSVNGLNTYLLSNNPNGYNPQRLDRSQAMTADMDHTYSDEQRAYDSGLVDKFPQSVAGGKDPSLVMDYYDGNTVTAMWNYAQHFAMSDNSFNTNYGPSTPGALNLISGQDHGAVAYSANVSQNGTALFPGQPGYPSWAMNSNNTLFGDVDPYFDNASKGSTAKLTGKNVGDLLNAKSISWGWFQGGFRDTTAKHQNLAGNWVTDYSPHHEPFQYYQSTANPDHLPPTSVDMIGKTDQANHQYDLTDFWAAVNNGKMPAVSFLKAPAYQDGHAGYSDPLDEQTFLVNTLNQLQSSRDWRSTAVVLAYDDSDGWYDHVMPPIVNQSSDPNEDFLLGSRMAGTVTGNQYNDRAGYGPRLPLLVISPYAKNNYVDHSVTDQSSILRFVEDNWNLGRVGDQSFDAIAGTLNNMFDFTSEPANKKLMLDPATGQTVKSDSSSNN